MRLKNILVKITVLALSTFFISSTVFAQSVKYPENFENYTAEQRIKWLDENIQPIVSQAQLVRNKVSDYKATRHHYARDESGSRVVGMRVTYYWRVNMDSTIEHYGISELTPLIISGYYRYLNKDVTSHYVNPGNVKICPQTHFASSFNGITVGHNVNLHSNGTISFTPYDISY